MGGGYSQAVAVLPAHHVSGGHVPQPPAHQEVAAVPRVREKEQNGTRDGKYRAAEGGAVV